MCIDVEELGLIERVDQVCPELETSRANKAYGLGHGDVPLVTAGQAERSDWRRSVLPAGGGTKAAGLNQSKPS